MLETLLTAPPIAPLAYTPFLDPLPINHDWFWLLLPLALGIASAYKAVRVLDLREFPKEVAVFTVQIVVGILGLGLAAFLIIEYLLPVIAPMP